MSRRPTGKSSKQPAKPKKAAVKEKPSRKPTKKEIDKAKEAIKARLDKTADEVGGKVRVHVYPDGSIDGEISIDVVKGQSASDLFLDVESAFKKQSLGKGFWISTGERHVIQEDAEVYRRHKGMNEVAVYYQRATPSNIAETMLIARRNITPAMERKYKRKASTIFVRLHWNADDKKPKRFR